MVHVRMRNPAVRAAGAVVWRRGPDGVEVLLVHRPRYDDWSFPKGKLGPGESEPDAAVREVEEETGLRGQLGPELPPSHYIDHAGRSKRVRYWTMEAGEADGRPFTPNAEVDEVRWVPAAEASALLSYDRDAVVLASLMARLAPADRRRALRSRAR